MVTSFSPTPTYVILYVKFAVAYFNFFENNGKMDRYTDKTTDSRKNTQADRQTEKKRQ